MRMILHTALTLGLAIGIANCSSDGENTDGEGQGQNANAIDNLYSLSFDGTDDFGSAGDITDTISGTSISRFSFSFWFKATGNPAVESTMLHMNPELEGGPSSMTVRLYWSTVSQISFHVTPNDASAGLGTTARAAVADPNDWNHVVGVFNTGQTSNHVTLYLNGELVDSGDQPTNLTSSGNIQWGKRSTNQDFFRGNLDEAAFWDVALDADQVLALFNDGVPGDIRENYGNYTSSSSLKSYWRMGDDNEGTGANVSDLISGNNFTIVGGGEFQTDVP